MNGFDFTLSGLQGKGLLKIGSMIGVHVTVWALSQPVDRVMKGIHIAL